MTSHDRADAAALDAADPLARFRARFVLGDEPRVYLDGNSLGRLPKETIERLDSTIRKWGADLVGAWAEWIDLPIRVGDLLANAALGAGAGEVVMADSTTVNLYKLAAAALSAREGAIVVDPDEFPTDRYVLEGLARAHDRELRRLGSEPVEGPTAERVRAACAAGPTALVCLSHVSYRSGALCDLRAITAAAHDAHALVLWDVSHSAGVVPVALEEAGADLAVGCSYKYLSGGPGSVAFLYVRRGLQQELRSPVQGWFGQRDQFLMDPSYEPADGVTRYLAGTPPILDLTAAEVGIRLVAEAGIDAIRAKSVSLTTLAIELHDAWLAPLGFSLGTPREPERRGGHVALRHPDAWRIRCALIERASVVPDFRVPDSIRFGFPPLYTSHADVWEAFARLRRLVEEGEQLAFSEALARVT